MARRQPATKTAIPDDISMPTAEQEALSTCDSAIQAAVKEDTQDGCHRDSMGSAAKKACEHDTIPAGDCSLGKQEASVSKDSEMLVPVEPPQTFANSTTAGGQAAGSQAKEKSNRPPLINLTTPKSAEETTDSEDAADGSSTTPSAPLSSTVPGRDPGATSVLPKEVSHASMDTGTPTNTKQSGTDVSPKSSGKRSTSLNARLTFLCSCRRSFDTRRGLSIHLAHEPKHYHKQGVSDSPVEEEMADTKDSQSAPSSPSPRDPSPPPQSPSSSTPNSPTHYSMASFKPSSRNPQYYSIIRTRRSNVSEGSTGSTQPETGTKRARSSVTPGMSASPAKAMLLNSGERVPVQQDEDVPGTSAETGGRKKTSGGKEGATSKVKDSGTSKCFDALSSPNTVLNKGLLGSSVMQEFNLRSSPVTRSNAASMKMKTHEFISLPSHRKRGGKRGGLRSGRDEGKLNISSEDNASEVGEDFDVSAEMKGEEEKVEEKSCSQESDKAASSDTDKVQPPKRKRGRPPKVRKDTPTGSPATLGAVVSAKSSSSPLSVPTPSQTPLTPISSSTRSGKAHGRGSGKGSANIKTESADENPLPSKTDSTSKGLGKVKGARSHDNGAHDEEAVPRDKEVESQDSPAPELPPPPPTKGTRKIGKGSVPPPSSPVPTSPVSKDSPASKQDAQGNKKHTRSHSKRVTADQGDGETATASRKKTGSKVSKTTSKDSSDADHQSASSSAKSTERKSSTSDTVNSKEQSKSGSTSSPAKGKTSKSKKSTPKSRTSSKSEHKKSVSEVGEATEGDGAAGVPVKSDGEERKDTMEEPAPPTAQITLAEQRQSVFVSVLSGADKKESVATPTTTAVEQTAVSESSSKEEGVGLHQKEAQRRMSETSPVFPYPASSTPTPTYPQFSPYHTPFATPPHMMYPPAAPPSTMYPFYGYPGTGHLQMAHPAHGPYYQHMVPPTGPPITTGDQISMAQNMLPQSPYGHAHPVQSPNGSASCSAPSSSAVIPPTVTSTATTVGGVRVSVLDKPPTQLPMVTLPYHMPSAAAPRPLRPQPGGYPMEIPSPSGMRAYIGGGGGHSPDGLEPRHLHPLSQVYRPGMIGPYPPAHLPMPHPAYHQAMPGVRLDPSGIPYMDWPEPRMPPSEEHPVQPVECPECGRVFKNNKALNGHMRLHGGFDWTKKPFTNTNADQAAKQSSSGSSSSSSVATATPNTKEGGKESEPKRVPASSSSSKSVRGKKRSRSSSRSRSRSKSPVASIAKASKSKRRKSSEDSGHHQPSNLLKEARSKDKEVRSKDKEAVATLPIPRAPSIFTFDPNSAQPHHKALVPSSSSTVAVAAAVGHSSSTSSTPSSEDQENGGSLTHSGSTLDDLCRAAAQLERMDTTDTPGGKKKEDVSQQEEGDDLSRRRPGNISIETPSPAIDRDRHRLGATPPYTPPPILSPSRSLLHLAPGVVGASQGTTTSAPCTPNRILQHWGNYPRKASETDLDSSFSEPRINIGDDFQAKLPHFDESRSGAEKDDPKATLLWKPLEGLTQEDESVIDGFMELACSPAVLHGGRNKELASHYLHALGGSVKEAVRWLLSGRSLFDPKSENGGSYNYSGSNRWSGRERQQFRRAWKVHRKQFNMLRSTVESKKLSDIIEYYYTWKKYCSDEYRGRNRHISEEIFSDEDDLTYPQVPSSSSSGSGESEQSNDNADQAKPQKSKKNADTGSMGPPPINSAQPGPTKMQQQASPYPQNRMFNSSLPIVYAPHTSPTSFSQHIHQFPCKYPGCNQIFTSIFALNGHIRVHGGSFFPKPTNGSPVRHDGPSLASSLSQAALSASSSSSSASPFTSVPRLPYSSSAHSGLHYTHKPYLNQNKSFGDLELARALLELPGSHSAAKSLSYHTPSPKPSPGKGKALAGPKKKLSSSSPGEHEGYYPCNRCGRVFTKVKSRSAHMKSHVVKAN